MTMTAIQSRPLFFDQLPCHRTGLVHSCLLSALERMKELREKGRKGSRLQGLLLIIVIGICNHSQAFPWG